MRQGIRLGRRIALAVLSATVVTSWGVLMASSAAEAQAPSFPPDSYMAKIQKRGKLIVAGKTELPGVGYLNPQTGKSEGFAVDLAEDLAMKIFGKPGHLEWRSVNAATRIPMLQQGVVDINIETMFITPERKQQIDFSEPYWGSPTLILLRKDDTTVKSIKDLDGKVVSVSKGSTTERAIREKRPGWPQANLLMLDDGAQTLTSIKVGRATATIIDEAIGLSIMKGDPSYKFLPEPVAYDYYGMGLAKGNPEFVKFVNDWLTDVKKNGKWKELYKQNLPGDVRDPPLPPYEKAYH